MFSTTSESTKWTHKYVKTIEIIGLNAFWDPIQFIFCMVFQLLQIQYVLFSCNCVHVHVLVRSNMLRKPHIKLNLKRICGIAKLF